MRNVCDSKFTPSDYSSVTPCKTLISIQLMNSKVWKNNKSKSIFYKVKVVTLINVFLYCCRYTRERGTLSQNLQPVQVCHMQTSEQTSFIEKETPCNKSESSAEAGYTKSTQTCNHPSVSVDMLDIVTENKNYSEESIISCIISHGTGFPDTMWDYTAYNWFFGIVFVFCHNV